MLTWWLFYITQRHCYKKHYVQIRVMYKLPGIIGQEPGQSNTPWSIESELKASNDSSFYHDTELATNSGQYQIFPKNSSLVREFTTLTFSSRRYTQHDVVSALQTDCLACCIVIIHTVLCKSQRRLVLKAKTHQ
jgi:hypothetical protein